jgi:TPR repeat protein
MKIYITAFLRAFMNIGMRSSLLFFMAALLVFDLKPMAPKTPDLSKKCDQAYKLYRAGQYRRAKLLFEQLSEQSQNIAIKACADYNLGLMHQDGNGGVPKGNLQLAKSYFEKVAKQEDYLWAQAAAVFKLGQIAYLSENDYSKARNFFTSASGQEVNKKAQAGAQLFIAEMYYRGCGLEQSYDEANALIDLVLAQEINLWALGGAQCYRGKMHYYGRGGVEKSKKKAADFFKLAMAQEHNKEAQEDSYFYLANIHYTDQEYDKAHKLFTALSTNPLEYTAYLGAQLMLGKMSYYGLGIEKDNSKARLHLGPLANQFFSPDMRSSAAELLTEIEKEGTSRKHELTERFQDAAAQSKRKR